jgi:hypothetical protein
MKCGSRSFDSARVLVADVTTLKAWGADATLITPCAS